MPIEFVVYDGDSSQTNSLKDIAQAMNAPIIIRSESTDYTILSYYYEDGHINLEIQAIN